MSKNNGSGRNQRNNPYQLDELLVQFNRSTAGLAWRWRTELATFASLAAVVTWLAVQITLPWAAVVSSDSITALLIIPVTRRFLIRRFWCILGRHRIQRLCYEARLHTRSGLVPLVLWTRPTRVGERFWVWCRAGVCAEDFEAHIGELRAACYARDARVTRNRRWSQMVTIDIIRRDTLAASEVIQSPLTRLTGRRQLEELPGSPQDQEPASAA